MGVAIAVPKVLVFPNPGIDLHRQYYGQFRSIVGSKVEMNFRSCNRKLNSVVGLTTDKVQQDTDNNPRYISAPRIDVKTFK